MRVLRGCPEVRGEGVTSHHLRFLWLFHRRLWQCDRVKNTVYAYFGLLVVAGLVSLTLLGASLLENGDNRGFPILAVLLAGLLLTFIHGAREDQRGRRESKVPAVASTCSITTTTSTAEYECEPAVVWSAIRPAEAAVALGVDVEHAFSVPAIEDGPRERQCFFLRSGQIHVIEIIEEIPERLAVTEPVLPPSDVGVRTTYRLEPTATGCRLTLEERVEMPPGFAADEQAMRRQSEAFLAGLAEHLKGGVVERARG